MIWLKETLKSAKNIPEEYAKKSHLIRSKVTKNVGKKHFGGCFSAVTPRRTDGDCQVVSLTKYTEICYNGQCVRVEYQVEICMVQKWLNEQKIDFERWILLVEN